MAKSRATLRRFNPAYKLAISLVVEPQLRWERRYRHPVPGVNERVIEYATALRWLADRYPESVLDIGPGEGVWPRLLQEAAVDVMAIDDIDSYWHGTYVNRHFKVTRGDITKWRPSRQFSCVTCISVLEHIADNIAAVRNMIEALSPGGDLIMTFPYNEHRYYPNVYALPTASHGAAGRYITQQYSRSEVEKWLADTDAVLGDIERWRIWTGDHWTEGERLPKPSPAEPNDPHQLACLRLRRPP